MDCATTVHVTRSGEYINGLDRGLPRDKRRMQDGLATSHFDRPCSSLHGSGRVCSGSAGSRSRCALTGILVLQRSVPQALNPLVGARFIAWGLRHPFLGECWVIFEANWRVCATVLRLDPRKKALCHTHLVGGTYDKYRRQTYARRPKHFTLRSAIFVGTWIWSGVFWRDRQSVEVRLDRHPCASKGRHPRL